MTTRTWLRILVCLVGIAVWAALPAERAFARTTGPIDRDDRDVDGATLHTTPAPGTASASTERPMSVDSERKSGNDVATLAQSAIVMAPAERSDATQKAMAMRWSP